MDINWNELWNEICFNIKKHKQVNSREDFFHTEVEYILEKLGWSRYKGEIISKKNYQLGSARTIQPDIIINLEDKDILVVEIKRPNSNCSESNIKQLFSYMRILKLDFGIYIGDTIQLFYEEPNSKKNPIKIFESEFLDNSENGIELIKLISKYQFDNQNLISFCERRIEIINDFKIAQEIITNLSKEESNKKLLEFLIESLKDDYNENILKIVKNRISIKVAPVLETTVVPSNSNYRETISKAKNFERKELINYEKLPIELIPDNTDEFTKLFMQQKQALLYYHYIDGEVKEKIWRNLRFNDNSDLLGNLRGRPEARKEKWKELGIVKLVCKINYDR